MFCKKMHQHLRDNACGIRDINKGEVGEKEIHGSLELAVQSDQNNKEVPQHCHQVRNQEQDRESQREQPECPSHWTGQGE